MPVMGVASGGEVFFFGGGGGGTPTSSSPIEAELNMPYINSS